MARKLFGTDGVRGRANDAPMTPETALRLGQAAGRYFTNGGHAHRVLIGKDTRRSGYMLETALTAGFTSVGMDVFLVGPVPTPAVGMLARSMRADLGRDDLRLAQPLRGQRHQVLRPRRLQALRRRRGGDRGAARGRARTSPSRRASAAPPASTTAAAATWSSPRPPSRAASASTGCKVVVDCANGAAYRTAPEVLWELGAEVIPVGVAPDGFNINRDCGSTHTATAVAAVRAHGADLGISLDGDADRVMIIDETGAVADGDQFMALIADRWAARGPARQGHARRHRDVEPRPRAPPAGAGPDAAAHRRRRPLRRRGDARGRLQPRRRAVRPHRDDRLRHHRRRPDRRAAVPLRHGRDRPARERARPRLPRLPAGADQRPLPQGRGPARRRPASAPPSPPARPASAAAAAS